MSRNFSNVSDALPWWLSAAYDIALQTVNCKLYCKLYRTVAEITHFKFGLFNTLDIAYIFDEAYKHQ